LYPTLTSKNYYGGVLVTIYVNFLFKYFINLQKILKLMIKFNTTSNYITYLG